jgi:hypothetical protein
LKKNYLDVSSIAWLLGNCRRIIIPSTEANRTFSGKYANRFSSRSFKTPLWNQGANFGSNSWSYRNAIINVFGVHHKKEINMALDFVVLVIGSIILLGHGLLILWPFLHSYF